MIVGDNRKATGEIMLHVLKQHQRKADYVTDRQRTVTLTDAPILILESQENPPTDFQHHVLVITSQVQSLTALCDLTPKSGIIVYPEWDSAIKTIAAKERSDVQALGYKPYKHEKNGSSVTLLSSTDERVPVKFSSVTQLEAAAAAKEVLKKIGITSRQFYQAISSFE